MTDYRPPVFLSSLWRSGSTYVWSRFRTDPAACCFYEPLHDGLATMSRAGIAKDTPSQIAGLRHPALAEPYFSEYAPLLRPFGGVPRFSADLAHDRWCLRPTEQHPRLARYIDRLIAHARNQQRQAVLGCVRASLRLGWIGRQRLDMRLVHLDRAPLDVWRSCVQQGEAGRSFFGNWLQVVWRNRDDATMAPVFERLPWPTGLRAGLTKPKHRHRAMLRAMAPEETYFLIAYMWGAAALHGLTHAHAVIDMNRSAEPGYNGLVGERLRELCRSDVNLEDMCVPPPATLAQPEDRSSIETAAMFALRHRTPSHLFDAQKVADRLAELAPEKAALLVQALPPLLRVGAPTKVSLVS